MIEQLPLIGVALLLVLLNGFFVATEFAIVKIRVTRLRALEEEGRPGARSANILVKNLDAYLSATQFGITLASLGLGWLGEPAFARLIEGALSPFVHSVGALSALSHSLAVVLAFAVITILHIVVGELAPKTLAIVQPEATALRVAPLMRIFYVLFYPGTWVLNRLAGVVLRLLGLQRLDAREEAHSEEELRMILASSAAAGAISSGRVELLEGALAMMEKTARQVLVPRNQVQFLDLEESLEKNIADARSAGHTWLPVARGTLDQVEGMVNVKDLFFLLSRGELRSLAQIQRPVLFVPESVTLEQLLAEFRRRKRQMAVVVDEHGGTSGLVSLADVVAELVGDVAALGRTEDDVKSLPGGRLELPGTAPLDDLADRLDVSFDVEDKGEVTTVAGFLMQHLGRVPNPGDRLKIGEFEIHVLETEGPRVLKVRIEPATPPVPPPHAPAGPRLPSA
ncbi:MAG: hemolysin family protein [Myxococcaceae bacterium]